MMSLDMNILSNFGGYRRNNLNHVVENHFNNKEDNPENINLLLSHYHTHDSMVATLLNILYEISILSLNCQSLNAKFDDILLLVEELRQAHFELSIICLQETWQDHNIDISSFYIQNYNCISQAKHCSNHGGLLIYVHESYNYDPNYISVKADLWEGMFLKIFHNKSNKYIYIRNMYRLPRENVTYQSIQIFIDELNAVITDIKKSKLNLILLGDFNIDLLKIGEKIGSQIFFEYILGLGLLPMLTLPTRIAEHSATLIDNVFVSPPCDRSQYISGILISNMSDHFPYFYCEKSSIKEKVKQKFMYSRKYNDDIFSNMHSELESSNILSQLDKNVASDPNVNYEILANIINATMSKHMAIKKIKLHKHKQKKSK